MPAVLYAYESYFDGRKLIEKLMKQNKQEIFVNKRLQ
jgi:hypothetical protein